MEFNLLFFQFGKVWTEDKRMQLNIELRYDILLILFCFYDTANDNIISVSKISAKLLYK